MSPSPHNSPTPLSGPFVFQGHKALTEELVLEDVFRTIPSSSTAIKRFRMIDPFHVDASDVHGSIARRVMSHPGGATSRYIFSRVRFRDDAAPESALGDLRVVVMDGTMARREIEADGLLAYLYNQAFEWLESFGRVTRADRIAMLDPPPLSVTNGKTQAFTAAPVAIGYERGSGRCTLLAIRSQPSGNVFVSFMNGKFDDDMVPERLRTES